MDRILNCFARNAAADAIDKANGFIHRGWLRSALRLGANLKTGKPFSLLAQNADYVSGGAGAKPDQNQLHGTGCGVALAVSIHHQSVSTAGDAHKALAVGPLRAGCSLFSGFGFQGLSPIVGLWFRVDQYSKELWRRLLETDFKRRAKVVHPGQR